MREKGDGGSEGLGLAGPEPGDDAARPPAQTSSAADPSPCVRDLASVDGDADSNRGRRRTDRASHDSCREGGETRVAQHGGGERVGA